MGIFLAERLWKTVRAVVGVHGYRSEQAEYVSDGRVRALCTAQGSRTTLHNLRTPEMTSGQRRPCVPQQQTERPKAVNPEREPTNRGVFELVECGLKKV